MKNLFSNTKYQKQSLLLALAATLALSSPGLSIAQTQAAERARQLLAAEGYTSTLVITPAEDARACKGRRALADFEAQLLERMVSGTVCDTSTHDTSTIVQR